MRSEIVACTLLVVSSLCAAQDLKVREAAERLLEGASAVSTSPKLPNLERVDSFRAFGDSGAQEGTFSRVVVQGVGRREEYRFGDYNLLNIWGQKQVAVAGSRRVLPAELADVLRITPIYLVRFDSEDVVHSIVDRNVGGRDARCINFDTIHGEHTDNNEICIDAANGTLLSAKLGRELIENSNFFPFAGALIPGKINYSFAGLPKLEVTQTMTELSPADANVLAPPPNSKVHRICTTYRRPFGVSMPQPTPGTGGSDSDVVIRAVVGVNGHVYDPEIQASERPDLNAEALELARQWTFTPAVCDGHADAHEVDFVLHYQGR